MKIIKRDYLLNIIAKNKSIKSKVKQEQIIKLIHEAEEPEKFFTKELLGEIWKDKTQLIQLIVNTGKIDRFFNMELLEKLMIKTYEVIIASGEQDKYLSLDKIVELDLSNYDVYEIIKSTNSPEKYLLPGQNFDLSSSYGFNIKYLKNKDGIEKYLNKSFLMKYNIYDENDIIDLIKLTGNIDKYLTVGTITDFGISGNGIDTLVRLSKMPERFLLPGQELKDGTKFNIANIIITEDEGNIKKYITRENFEKYRINKDPDAIVSLIKAMGNIDDYLTPEIVKELKLPIYKLIKESPNPNKYLFPGQELGEYGIDIDNIIYATGKENIDKYLTLEYVKGFSNEKITRLVKSMDNYEKYFFPKQQDEKFTIENCWYAHLSEDERKRIDQFCEINDDIIKYNTFLILDKKYIELFSEDKVLLMASYPKIVTKVCSLDYNKLSIINKIIDIYEKIGETDEWTYLFEKIINNCSEFDALFSSINDETLRGLDIETLQNLMLVIKDKNILRITDINELMPENFKNIVHERLQEKIYSNNKVAVLDAVLYSKFRITNDEAKIILAHYGEDINKIKNEDIKNYVLMIKKIQDADIETLREIYEKVEPVKLINNLLIEKALKKEYMKLYNDKTFNLKYAVPNKELGENVYELPIDENGNVKDFGMIVSCVTKTDDDYYLSWNQKTYSKSKIFCTSYIQRGMCGTVINSDAWHGLKEVIYGFTNIPEDNLMFSLGGDAGTFGESFTPSSGLSSLFESPERIINRGVDNSCNYNEMNFKRFFNGKRIQPSYIVAFKKNNKIDNLDKSQEASRDFEKHTGKKLPIIIVDLDKCLIAEKNYINNLIKECKESYSKELYDSIVQRRKNIVLSGVYDKEECEQFLLDTEIDSIEIKNEEDIIGVDDEKSNTEKIENINSILGRLSLMYKNKGITVKNINNAMKTVTNEMNEQKKKMKDGEEK